MNLVDATGRSWLEEHVDEALAEDLGGRGDITSAATIPARLAGEAELIAKQQGILAGAQWAVTCGERTDPPVEWSFDVSDGERVRPGQRIARVQGPMRGILISERTALNGLGRLSGIATMTAEAVKAVQATDAVVVDTRKTTPGWRLAEKYAVRAGGGANHRIGLYDEVLIKENHIAAAGGVRQAIEAALHWREEQAERAGTVIEVEVRDQAELREALAAGPDRVLLDNFSLEALREAVALARGRAVLEASGGITLETLAEVGATGVDRVSLGALTHTLRPLDVSLLARASFQA
jgi:nicotinate-nucleotide pyrophosphorylase (carboxylating)